METGWLLSQEAPQLPWARAMGRPGVRRVLEMTLLVLLEAGPSLWASYHCVLVTAQLHLLREAGQLVSWSAGQLGLRESWARFFCAWPATLPSGIRDMPARLLKPGNRK